MGFRIIPNYPKYAVDEYGCVIDVVNGLAPYYFILDGYIYLEVKYDSPTKHLRLHRAVALAWISNPDPAKYKIVNHIDGNKFHNFAPNLEWTDYSGNNYHAINNGLRSDNIPCMIRNYFTSEVLEFASLAQAAEHMGLRKDTPISMLNPKQFGRLVNGVWEFKYLNDNEPWFYEERSLLVNPVRYIVQHIDPNGNSREIYSTKNFIKDYNLYRAPIKSVPELAVFAEKTYPGHRFIVLDSYAIDRHIETRDTKQSFRQEIIAENGAKVLRFSSLTSAAAHFGVDRSVITNRISKGEKLGDWYLK